MRLIFVTTERSRKAEIYTDGGAYYLHLFENDMEVEIKPFLEYTLRIVENYAKEWIKNES
jgi:hypothetical protein